MGGILSRSYFKIGKIGLVNNSVEFQRFWK